MKIKALYNKFKLCSGISTDTRKISPNSMFFALKGDNFDGNTFVTKAFENGAKYCVVDDEKAVLNAQCLLVSDTLKALQEMAALHRNSIGIPIIALTGSNGKTTTKELIQGVLSTTYKVKSTIGNLNNHIGVPLTLLNFDKTLDFGIVEMGANHQKEIEFLSNIAQPDFGLITNFGKAHLEGFGGTEGVIKGKSELYDYIKSNNKTIFINTDDKEQVKQVKGYTKVLTFGSNPNNDFNIEFISANPYVKVKFNNTVITSQLIGDYNFGNIAIAIAIGQFFKISEANIKRAIESYQPTNNRSQVLKIGSNRIILDAYNANPTSMLAALKNFKQLESEHKYLFLGDMFELGEFALKEHQAIVNFVQENFQENIFIIGEHFYQTLSPNSIKKFRRFEDLCDYLKHHKIINASVFIKGSRGMALERLLQII
ncbi:UDP-N-acetylmuramoyl-tripeptide--D-alanyl-D-alanine ligase [Winogradskyella aurantia]|uniref:UDP-N-acetylmuramoyl-tripeptide--D-alanyl-D-alanine ligase n=1 Tax=Winogradskyella aurantia TaxID=1915063 RepID=A0A265UPC1_9FLAO|nr:UDP-N-acetylmuramoyl-tripeptide--D-alanyl-D-alanine ligase [Winogradskyella aurantia]OZV66917.1 UDP-N-acetylmuramoyl-tripeptide--D-alanyl-D-alanine ligase [Winogradskyella aurantia]